MSEDIYERSAQEALRIASNAKPSNGDRSATEVGLQVVSTSHASEMMNEGRRFAGGVGNAPGDVQAREHEETRRMRAARTSIIESGGISMDDLLDVTINDGGADAADAMAIKRRRGAVNQYLGETQNRPASQPQFIQSTGQSVDGWQVIETTAGLANGKRATVYLVEDALSGMTTGKKYRVAAVAEKVARVLSATNNLDDPRIRMIDQMYEQHVKLMRERADARKANDGRRVSVIESKLKEVNTRLGIN